MFHSLTNFDFISNEFESHKKLTQNIKVHKYIYISQVLLGYIDKNINPLFTSKCENV
jgi:hypothetical protein